MAATYEGGGLDGTGMFVASKETGVTTDSGEGRSTVEGVGEDTIEVVVVGNDCDRC